MEEPLSNDELRELHRIAQEAALEAYPNPARIGCPGRDILREVAASPWPADHEAYNHIKECSPCLREMLELGKAMDREKKRRRLYRISAIAAGLVLICGIFIQWWKMQNASHSVGVIAQWNLQSASALRGVEDYQQRIHLEAPPRRGIIAVVLPLGSE